MRYLGNKESIKSEILALLKEKDLTNKNYVFFDAFCGTGTVASYLKDIFKIVLNDNMLFASTYSHGRLYKGHVTFEHLGFNPIDFFNSNSNTTDGFFANNYSPIYSGRMYFSDFNAGRIDYFRETIEAWYQNNKINLNEYSYLLACLLESLSKVANIAGVYGAYLKKWDPRAVKDIKFIEVEDVASINTPVLLNCYNCDIKDIIENVNCDILYLDPPYTKNKYSVQYHLLETLIRNDRPKLKGITGTRDLSFLSDAWSKKYDVDVEFEYVIAKTKAKHIVVSYSSDGLMSKEYISSVLRRYGNPNSFEVRDINYKKYRNSRTHSTDEHYEYLFYIEKKDINDVEYCCPLNYMGGKTNVIKYIRPELYGKSTFIDLMGGGFNVGINANSYSNVIYNDINFIVKDLLMMFKQTDTPSLLKKIELIIANYKLEKNQASPYLKLRNDYNLLYRKQGNYAIYLYTLILYGFQQQIRFNSKYEFNNPVGESGFNDSIREKIVSFSRKIKELDIIFYSQDYEKIEYLINKNCLIYIDPPYLITLGSYNDGKRGFNGWNDMEEVRLLNFIDRIKKTGCKIIISNIIEYKDKQNVFLAKWINQNNAKTKIISVRGREEVLITYEANISN